MVCAAFAQSMTSCAEVMLRHKCSLFSIDAANSGEQSFRGDDHSTFDSALQNVERTHHRWIPPPSTAIVWPVMNPLSTEARNNSTRARSSG